MTIKSFIPKIVKRKLKQILRSFRDKLSGVRFAGLRKNVKTFSYSVTLTQPIKVAHLYENKIENLKLASSKINEIIIAPGEVFSFWRVIGDPSGKNGYKKGRNIVEGVMSEEYGGGLCQLSGILYHLSLITGLEIVERYNHSVDFYTEDNRYTPIGCDATVVYGYKDLRIKNGFDFPVRFYIETGKETLTATMKSTVPVSEKRILFDKKESTDYTEVCLLNESGKLLNRSIYTKLKKSDTQSKR